MPVSPGWDHSTQFTISNRQKLPQELQSETSRAALVAMSNEVPCHTTKHEAKVSDWGNCTSHEIQA